LRAPPLVLNRLLFEPHEVLLPGRVVLPLADKRATHVARVLQLRDGDSIRVGVLDGGADDAAQVRWIWPQGSSGEWSENAPRSQRPGRLTIEDMRTALEQEPDLPEALELTLGEETLRSPPYSPPRVDMLLVPPCEEALKRLFPQIAQLGVGTIVICNAARCPNAIFGTRWLNNPSFVRSLLVEGLVQSGDTSVPKVVLAKRLRPFLFGGQLDEIAPRGTTLRLVATRRGARMSQVVGLPSVFPGSAAPPARIMLALGPEGGWLEPMESDALADAGFAPVSLGPRPLRPEVAALSSLALATDAVRRWDAVSKAVGGEP